MILKLAALQFTALEIAYIQIKLLCTKSCPQCSVLISFPFYCRGITSYFCVIPPWFPSLWFYASFLKATKYSEIRSHYNEEKFKTCYHTLGSACQIFMKLLKSHKSKSMKNTFRAALFQLFPNYYSYAREDLQGHLNTACIAMKNLGSP